MRFRARIESRSRRWERYTQAKEMMRERTSILEAPWCGAGGR